MALISPFTFFFWLKKIRLIFICLFSKGWRMCSRVHSINSLNHVIVDVIRGNFIRSWVSCLWWHRNNNHIIKKKKKPLSGVCAHTHTNTGEKLPPIHLLWLLLQFCPLNKGGIPCIFFTPSIYKSHSWMLCHYESRLALWCKASLILKMKHP